MKDSIDANDLEDICMSCKRYSWLLSSDLKCKMSGNICIAGNFFKNKLVWLLNLATHSDILSK